MIQTRKKTKLIPLISAFVIIAAVLSLVQTGMLSVLILLVFLILISAKTLPDYFEIGDRRSLAFYLVLALIFRAVLMFVIDVGDLYHFFGGDTVTYHIWGTLIAETWQRDGFGGLGKIQEMVTSGVGMHPGWYYLVGILYSVYGSHIMVPAVFNIFFSLLTGVLIYRLSFLLFADRKVSKTACIITLFTPSYIMWSSAAFKDPICILLLVGTLYQCVRIEKKFSLQSMLMISFMLTGLYLVRFYLLYVMILVMVTYFMFMRIRKLFYNIATLGILIIGMTLSLKLVGTSETAIVERGSSYSAFETLNEQRQGAAYNAQSAFETDADISTPTGALEFLPTGILYFMFAPFPWTIRNFRQAIAGGEMFLWILLFPSFIKGIKIALKSKIQPVKALFVYCAVTTLFFSLVSGNIGTLYRLKMQVFVIFFIFISLGLATRKRKHVVIST